VALDDSPTAEPAFVRRLGERLARRASARGLVPIHARKPRRITRRWLTSPASRPVIGSAGPDDDSQLPTVRAECMTVVMSELDRRQASYTGQGGCINRP
jgi:hypothetical protein